MKYIRLIIITALLSVACTAVAQTDADNLYLEGQKLQQTMTVAKQNEAIKKFNAAKVLYTSSSKKTMCDNQITQCKKNISSIKATAAAKKKAQEAKKEEDVVEEQPKEEVKVETHKDVQLSLSESALQFKRKPKDGATQSVVVTCNYDDWEITSKPDWVTISIATGKFYVEVEENAGDERSGVIRVKCGDKEVDLVINQKGPGTMKKLTNKVKETIDNI